MRLHLVDGTYELFRAHFSPAARRHRAGWADVKATVGLVSSMLALLHDAERGGDPRRGRVRQPHPLVPQRSLRRLQDRRRRAARAARPVRPASRRPCARSGVTVWSMKDFEADDALATAAARWAGRGEQVRMLTPDKDLGQCVRGDAGGAGGPQAAARCSTRTRVRGRSWACARERAGPAGARGRRRRRHPRAARLRREGRVARCSAPTATWRRFPPDAGAVDACARAARTSSRHPARAPRGGAAVPQAGDAGERCRWPNPSRTCASAACRAPASTTGATRVGSETLRTMPRRWLE